MFKDTHKQLKLKLLKCDERISEVKVLFSSRVAIHLIGSTTSFTPRMRDESHRPYDSCARMVDGHRNSRKLKHYVGEGLYSNENT